PPPPPPPPILLLRSSSSMPDSSLPPRGRMPSGGSPAPRPLMLRCVRRLREAGLTVAALTNNYAPGPPSSEAERIRREEEHAAFAARFDHFIRESRVVGLSKPDPKIYSLALRQIGCQASEAIFLDDIKVNLKAPAQMGVHTILVRNETECSFHEALRELEVVSGVKLLDGSTNVDELPASRL
ncbi:unnamed protein product, partial [Prorocentrum cordatum]